jgi:hypothetical protein
MTCTDAQGFLAPPKNKFLHSPAPNNVNHAHPEADYGR